MHTRAVWFDGHAHLQSFSNQHRLLGKGTRHRALPCTDRCRPSRGSEDDRHFRPIPSNGVCSLLSDKWIVPVLWRRSLAEDHRLRF
ncbi:hypothetical protein EIQ31_18530 [Agrobacterium deltaense]|nr:hypothetical protein EIQ31_18530 [Agrobacterium deltaense]